MTDQPCGSKSPPCQGGQRDGPRTYESDPQGFTHHLHKSTATTGTQGLLKICPRVRFILEATAKLLVLASEREVRLEDASPQPELLSS